MARHSRETVSLTDICVATLAGLGQLALVGTWHGGLLVLAGLFLVSPWVAALAAAGALLGSVAAWLLGPYERQGWLAGLGGYNAAVVGLWWAGAFAAGQIDARLVASTLFACIGLEALCMRVFRRIRQPPLTLPAVVTLWGTSAIAAPAGTWFWLDPPLHHEHLALVLLSVAAILAAMALKSGRAAALAAAAAVAVLVACAIFSEQTPMRFFGLWGLNVPLAVFAMAGVFLPHSRLGLIMGGLAGGVAGALWLTWTGLEDVVALPPLVAPFILSVWLAIVLGQRLMGSPLLQPAFGRAAWALARAALRGRPVCVIAEASLPWDPLMDPRSWTWLDRNLPRDAYTLASFRDSPRSRWAYWDACDRLRHQEAPRRALAPDTVDAIFDADPRPASDPANSVRRRFPLRGRVERVRCLDCGQETEWPPRGIWRVADLLCTTCGGFLKPDIALLPEDDTVAWSRSGLPDSAAEWFGTGGTAGVVILYGPVSHDPRIDGLLQRARAARWQVVQLTGTGTCYGHGPGDHVVIGEPERLLASLLTILGAARRVGRRSVESGHGAMPSRRERKVRAGLAAGSAAMVAIGLVLWAGLSTTLGAARPRPRIEPITIPSFSGEWDDIRTGRYRAAPVNLTGEIYWPAETSQPVAAAILLHGSDGSLSLQKDYAARLAAIGLAAVVVDSFRPRGVESTVGNQNAVTAYSMTIDAYQTMLALSADPRIDQKRIAVIGWSKGGLAADLASRAWFEAYLARGPLRFAAHVAFYSWCGEQPARPRQTGAPILYLLGGRDDWTGPETCIRYAERLRDAGYPARAIVFPGAYHGFDAPGLFKRHVAGAEALGNCVYIPEDSEFRDLRSGQTYHWASFGDYLRSCGGAGAHVASNTYARKAAWRELTRFLADTLYKDRT